MKKCLEVLPDFNRVLPTQRGEGKVCVLLPFFKSGGCITVEWVKASLWNLNAFIVNTNLREVGWDIFVYIDEHVAVDAECMRLLKPAIDAGYVTQFSFKTLPSDILSDSSYRLGQSIYPVIDDQFDKYEYVFSWDLDMFLCRVEGAEVFDLNNLISESKGFSLDSFHLEYQDFYFTNQSYLWNLKGFKELISLEGFDDLSESDYITKQYPYWVDMMNKVTGCDIIPYTQGVFPVLDAGIHRFCPDTITDEFKEFIREAEPILGDDEGVAIAWYLKTGEDIVSLILERDFPQIRWVLESKHEDEMDFMKYRMYNPNYLAHAPVSDRTSKKETSLWLSDLGVERCI